MGDRAQGLHFLIHEDGAIATILTHEGKCHSNYPRLNSARVTKKDMQIRA